MNKAQRFNALARLGCIVCYNNNYPDTPCSIHHLRDHTGAGRKEHWSQTIGLCPTHHQYGDGGERFNGELAYHCAPRTWEARYGTQEFFLAQTNDLIGAT